MLRSYTALCEDGVYMESRIKFVANNCYEDLIV